MKNPLDYTEDELRTLSISELQLLKDKASYFEDQKNTEQTVLKLQINSLYGALGNKHFPLFNEAIACAITGNGRYFIRKLANYIEDKLQSMIKSDTPYVVGGDTDSIYVTIAPFMDMYMAKTPGLSINEYVDWADTFEKKVIQEQTQRCIKDFSTELNAYNPDIIGAEREVIADCMVLCQKKKYFGRVRDNEGTRYPEDAPYIKVMGLEIIKSSTPKFSQKWLKEAIPCIMDGTETELSDWIKDIKNKYIGTNLTELAAVGGVSRIDYNLTDKGVPIGARAAIIHNKYIKEHGLEDSIAPINAGDKCKRLYLQEPNAFGSNIVAFTNDSFITEIEKHECVDYDTQFQKTFLKPLELMTDCLHYNLERETEIFGDDW